MAKSIIQSRKECLFCGALSRLEKHHCIHGTANRKLAEKYGLTVWLCAEHHRGRNGVHMNMDLDRELKKLAQHYFELRYTHEEWMMIFGKNYL